MKLDSIGSLKKPVQCPSHTGISTFLKRSIHIHVNVVGQRPHNASGDVHFDLGANARQGMGGVLMKGLTIASDVGSKDPDVGSGRSPG